MASQISEKQGGEREKEHRSSVYRRGKSQVDGRFIFEIVAVNQINASNEICHLDSVDDCDWCADSAR